MTAPTFAPPGPGAWELDSTHLTRPLTRYMAELFPPAFSRGFAEGARSYGLMLDRLEMQVVNGFSYMCARAVGAPPNAVAPPPKLVFQILSRVHPEMRRRIKTADRAISEKLWRQDLSRWDTDLKPNTIKRQLALVAVNPGGLDDAGLAKHLEDCRAHLEAMIMQHHRYSITATLPVADYLLHVQEWTGLTMEKIMPTLKGATPESANRSPELAALAAALRDAPDAVSLLRDHAPREALAALRQRSGAVGEAARAYLDCAGYRCVQGYDVGDPYGLELPDLLVRNALDALDRPARTEDGAEAIARVREAVPEAQRANFDALLAEARLIYRLRDERTLYSDLWAAGITRRGLLEAGARLAKAGRLDQAEHMVHAAPGEVRELMAGRGPSAAELVERAAYRARYTTSDAPEILGPAPGGSPPLEWFPTPAARRVQAATMAVLDGIFKVSTAKAEPKRLEGLAVGGGTYEGTARLVLGPERFDALQQGDVLITRATSPTFNVILPLLGGIVTDRGGSLCHAAIVAREFGLPAVVGTREASKLIPDGARVRVNGDTGVVEVLD